MSRQSIGEHIAECFLDLMEEKPFYSIKVRELVEHASIARSTFYAYYDSIFDVVQRMEDGFLEDFYPMDSARQVLLGKKRARCRSSKPLRDRTCARGQPASQGRTATRIFSKRLERHIEDICFRIWAESDSPYSEDEKRSFAAYIAGGTLAIIRLEAQRALSNTAAEPSKRTSKTVIAANSILLGARTQGCRKQPSAAPIGPPHVTP